MTRVPLDSLNWALSHVKKHSNWDLLPFPFEYEVVERQWETLRGHLSRQGSAWALRAYRLCLTPKHRFGFRMSTQLDPLDNILLASLTHLLGESLERSRVGPENAFGFRFAPDETGRLFEKDRTWSAFDRLAVERADRSDVTHVLVTDIADFFPGMYFHRVEEAVSEAEPAWAGQLALRLLKDLNQSISASLPVGPPFGFLLAEAALNPLDRLLKDRCYDYIRLCDDFRFFCGSYREAWQALTCLAEHLYEQYRLFLQAGKTRIVEKTRFVEENTGDVAKQEIERLEALLHELAPELGVVDDYRGTEPALEELDEETMVRLRELDWVGLLRGELESGFFSLHKVSYALSRLRMCGDARAVDLVLENLDVLAVVAREVVKFLGALDLEGGRREEIARRLLEAERQGLLGNTDYERVWLWQGVKGERRGPSQDLVADFRRRNASSPLLQREFLLSCDNSLDAHVVKPLKSHFRDLNPWNRRALLRASRCLDSEERKAWLRAIRRNLDPLEDAVMKQAES